MQNHNYIKMLNKKVEVLSKELDSRNFKLKTLNEIDFFSKIPNREFMYQYIDDCISKNIHIGIMLLNIDNFKLFNDIYGYLVGENLLITLTQNLLHFIPESKGIVAYLKGEGFLIVLPNVSNKELNNMGATIIESSRELKIRLPNEKEIYSNVTFSIGSTIWNGEPNMTTLMLFNQVYSALKKAKSEGKNRYILFDFKDNSFYNKLENDKEFLSEISHVLQTKQIEVFYQPLYNIKNNTIVGCEALARWRHPIKGLLTPDKFIPLFEQFGLITELDLHLFEENCKNIRRWIDNNDVFVPICCNFSRLHFFNPNFPSMLKGITEKYSVSTSNFSIEITENILIENTNTIIQQLAELRSYGFSVSMDDFGSGYSSFGMLQNLPFDIIKIDRIFLSHNLNDFKNTTILYSIINIARALGMLTVCEGVETEQHVEFIKSINCDIAQGYYYAKPMECKEFEKLLSKENNSEKMFIKYSDIGKSLIEKIFDGFFIMQDMKKLRANVTEDIQWFDFYNKTEITSFSKVIEHFEKHIKGKKFSILYKSITPHNTESDSLLISGEAVLSDEASEHQKYSNFYFSANCIISENKLLLAKLHLDLIKTAGYINEFESYSIPKMTNTHLDESNILSQFYSMLPVGIIRYDLFGDMIITYMNEEMFDIIGYTKEQFFGEMGGNLRAIVHPDDLDFVYKKSLDMIDTNKIEPFLYRFIKRDGQIVTVMYTQCNLSAIDGRSIAQGMYVDVNKIKNLTKI
ncbi:TPA: EAL domain-containing protein [Clostridioides difficile]|uniref:EAL domain-containing protein n=1 Tax=Clostridioides difficile TaxID=1496 RepID=UPI0003B28D14|nr:EAL domain-containing protein [Clostridioides difficile]EGT4232367.1 EAL domain-containing protein [Clostridioides difficile]EGT5078854.1 EAL domain-containing protein [Clostridioides difficile]EGT5135513.1 EAL domain-containing protein [Clostridioides difficile]EGT5281593.1 EAL domain-containing protein [Clostridioides difficile]EGT5398472.1 EAL domain-containing protein [Clostridioides difficile]